jgi:hypothetical protein
MKIWIDDAVEQDDAGDEAQKKTRRYGEGGTRRS